MPTRLNALLCKSNFICRFTSSGDSFPGIHGIEATLGIFARDRNPSAKRLKPGFTADPRRLKAVRYPKAGVKSAHQLRRIEFQAVSSFNNSKLGEKGY